MITLTPSQELLQAYAIHQDQAAFRRLMEQYFRFVYGAALRVTGNSAMAEEVCQDVFLLLSQQARKLLAKDVNLAGWLHRVAWNKAQNLRVREQRGRKRDRNFAQEAVVEISNLETGTALLDEALEKLSDADKEILLWHYVDQLSFKEIADRLEITAEAAQKRSIRALRRLSRLMKTAPTEDAANPWNALLPALLIPAMSEIALRPCIEKTMFGIAQSAGKLSLTAKAGIMLASGKGFAALIVVVLIPLAIHKFQAPALAVEVPKIVVEPREVLRETVVEVAAPVAPESIQQESIPASVVSQNVSENKLESILSPSVAKPVQPQVEVASSPIPTVVAAPMAVGAELPIAKIKIGVVPAVMKFDVTRFTIMPGQRVALLFSNEKCPLQHNISILKPGTKDKVAAEAMKAVTDPEFMKHNCFVDSPDILFKGSKLVGPGQSDLLQFTAPVEPGDYPFVCTFPGHCSIMSGVMEVRPAK